MSSSIVGDSFIADLIRKAIRERLEFMAKEEILQAQNRLTRRLEEIVANIAISVLKNVVIEHYQQELVIRVQFNDKVDA